MDYYEGIILIFYTLFFGAFVMSEIVAMLACFLFISLSSRPYMVLLRVSTPICTKLYMAKFLCYTSIHSHSVTFTAFISHTVSCPGLHTDLILQQSLSSLHTFFFHWMMPAQVVSYPYCSETSVINYTCVLISLLRVWGTWSYFGSCSSSGAHLEVYILQCIV